MKLKITSSKFLPIGVDLGSSSVKLAQFRLDEEDYELVAAAAATLPAEGRNDHALRMEQMAGAIANSLSDGPFDGRCCILSLPPDATAVRHVKLPPLPPDELDEALRGELSGKLPYPIDQAEVRHVVAGDVYGEGDRRQEVIAVCASRAVLESYLAMAAACRLDVAGINVAPMAIVECFARLFRRAADQTRSILFVDIGAACTQVVLSRGAKVVFARALAMGGEKFDQAAAEGLHVAPAQANAMRRDLQKASGASEAAEDFYHHLDAATEAMAHELTQCLRYYESVFHYQPVERAIFLGAQAYDKRLCQAIAQRLNLPAQIGDPMLRIRRPPGPSADAGIDRRSEQPEWAVAVGLSLGWAA